MWSECGIQFRSNIVFSAGGQIPLHAHSYDHISIITHGWFAVEEILPDKSLKTYQMASRGFLPTLTTQRFEPIGYRTTILSGHQHKFTLLEKTDGPGEVLCLWVSEQR
jgi:hypothetical protein